MQVGLSHLAADRDLSLPRSVAFVATEREYVQEGLVGSRSGRDDTLCAHVFTTGVALRLDNANERLGLPPTVLADSFDVGPLLSPR